MKKALVLAAALALLPLPALSQGMSRSEDRDSSDHRKDRDLEGVLREMGVSTRGGGGGRGASFFLRNGDSTVAVRCDPGDSMRACVDATLTLIDKAKAAQTGTTTTPGTPPPAR
ncbi:MAG TPA: hypothetical protein VGJ01_15710 [Pseudolabrys sp.]|jgi:hypothetical protein